MVAAAVAMVIDRDDGRRADGRPSTHGAVASCRAFVDTPATRRLAALDGQIRRRHRLRDRVGPGASWSTWPTAASWRQRSIDTANGVIDEHLPAPDEDVRLEPDWALQDPADYLRTVQQTVPQLLTQTGVDPGRRHRRGHRLHGLHDAADDRRRHAAVHDPRVPAPPPRLGQALEAPRRATRSRPNQRRRARARRAVVAALWRQDLVGVVLLEEPADPRRGSRAVSRPPTG